MHEHLSHTTVDEDAAQLRRPFHVERTRQSRWATRVVCQGYPLIELRSAQLGERPVLVVCLAVEAVETQEDGGRRDRFGSENDLVLTGVEIECVQASTCPVRGERPGGHTVEILQRGGGVVARTSAFPCLMDAIDGRPAPPGGGHLARRVGETGIEPVGVAVARRQIATSGLDEIGHDFGTLSRGGLDGRGGGEVGWGEVHDRSHSRPIGIDR